MMHQLQKCINLTKCSNQLFLERHIIIFLLRCQFIQKVINIQLIQFDKIQDKAKIKFVTIHFKRKNNVISRRFTFI
ncbi:unnamed protein product [Paramecium octaurelia]|uniref:Uncharacterized protein n=1 Tax=Paramecium octaurelia TaxID=43137 RepID=A0A8S1XAF1_PAROT|nr:unnamed protein product [Paramecium octaurelia]